MKKTTLVLAATSFLFLHGCNDSNTSETSIQPNDPKPISPKGIKKDSTKNLAGEPTTSNNNIIVMELQHGSVEIALYPEIAPNHVKRIKDLTREKFYDGIVFHRVIDGFMAQTGDPTGTGTGGSKKPNLKAEFNDTSHKRGVLSMARSQSPHSANSQFFIVLSTSPHLDNNYTAFGRVIKGMKFVDKIKKGAPGSGSVVNPDKIIRMYIKD